jgi:hypothetical protein
MSAAIASEVQWSSKMQVIAIVEYQVATYSGKIEVRCDENETNDEVEARAKAQLSKQVGGLPYGYQSFRVVQRY